MEAADAGEDAIKVPSDGVIDNEVNGITNGDTVFINKNEYTVGVVVDDGNTATITLTSGLQAPLAFGDRIAERETFEVTLDNVGTITEDAETGTVTITVTATSTSPGAPEADDDVVLTLLTPVGPSVEKYVRNVTPENDRNPADNLEWVEEGFAYEYPSGSETFYFRSQLNDDDARDPSKKNPDAKVKAKKDDILEYLIVLKAGNQKDRTGITLNETLSPFTAYLGGMTKVNNQPFKDNDDGNSPVLTENWPVTDAGGAPLTLTANTSAHVTYKVTVIGGVGDRDDKKWITGGPNNDCRHNADGLWAPDVQDGATKCKGVKWNAANGIDVATNPVCWDTVQFGDGWQVGGNNPWVVGTATQHNNEAYDCRVKCADKGGESFGHCAADGWWDNVTAESTICEIEGQEVSMAGENVDEGWTVQARGGWRWLRVASQKCLN